MKMALTTFHNLQVGQVLAESTVVQQHNKLLIPVFKTEHIPKHPHSDHGLAGSTAALQ